MKKPQSWGHPTGVIDARKEGYHEGWAPTSVDKLPSDRRPKSLSEAGFFPILSWDGDTYQWAGTQEKPNDKNPEMR